MSVSQVVSASAYGRRARIGYTSVAYVTEVFPYAFYRMVPDGVSLALLTLHQTELDRNEMDRLYEESMRAAKALAKSGVDLLVLGGRPVLLSRGAESLDALTAELEKELGVPVTTDAGAQLEAYRALGSKRIATVHPFAEGDNDRHAHMIRQLGFEPSGCSGGGSNLIDLPKLAPADAVAWARDLMARSPDTDTILFPCPHWATVEAIEPLEREFGVNVVTNLQATVWHALRRCGITNPIEGYGRLLRDF